MKKFLFLLPVFVVAACFTFNYGTAQDGGKGKGGKGGGGASKGGSKGGMQRPEPPKFADVDTNKSGDLDKEEWIAYQVKAAKERAERMYDFMAKDGKISEEDFNRMSSRFSGRGGGKGGSKGGGASGKGKGGGKGGSGKGGEGEGDKPKRPAVEA